MPAYRFFQLLITCTFILASIPAYSQHNSIKILNKYADTMAIKNDIIFLADPICEGRATGTPGADNARILILNRYKQLKLNTFNNFFTQSFITGNIVGRNIIGYIPAKSKSTKYIIIGAHYDNIGILYGNLYPGADANASGTAALLELAKIFTCLRETGIMPKINIVFVAFDAKERNLAGSRYLASHLPFRSSDAICMINLDQIGSILAPPRKYPDNYLLVLGRRYLPQNISSAISQANAHLTRPLKIDYTFYGSPSFHDTFYRLSDHYPFHKKNIPAVMFTAGINQNNYKVTDTAGTIKYNVMKNRILLAANLIYKLAYNH